MSVDENNSKIKPKRQISWVWQYFKEVTKEIILDEEGEDNDERKKETYLVMQCQVKETPSSAICGKEYIRKDASTNAISHLRLKHDITQSSEGTVLTMKRKNHSEQRQTELRQFLVDWVVLDSQPLSTVQNKAFRHFIHELDSAFIMPSQETVKKIIYDAFHYSFPQLKQSLLTDATFISLTMDLWTARNRQGYLGVTCSYLNPSFTLCELTLDIAYIRYPHTAINIKDTLENILHEWGIHNKIFTITTDNASNMKKCVQDMEGVNWLRCTAHTLQLVVGKGMKPAEVLVARAKQLINFFMRPKQSERLEDVQNRFPELANELELQIALQYTEENNEEIEQEEIKPGDTSKYLHLISDSPTRWNSSYLAWNRLLLLKNHISMVLNSLSTKDDLDSKKDYKILKKIMLSPEEWDLLKDLRPILRPFSEATELLGGSNYCTISIMTPILIGIKKRFAPHTTIEYDINFQNEEIAFDEAIDDDDNELEQSSQQTTTRKFNLKDPINTRNLLTKIKSALYMSMDYYWKDLTKPNTLLPSLLDPRIKDLSVVTPSDFNDTKDLLRVKYNNMELEIGSIQNQQNFTSQSAIIQLSKSPAGSKKKKGKNLTILTGLKKPTLRAHNEIAEYLQMEQIDFESDPFTWWYERQEKFPILSYLAKKYLSVYACSTASERLFSDAGNLLTAKRTRISPKLFKRLIFLKRNAKHLDSIHKPYNS